MASGPYVARGSLLEAEAPEGSGVPAPLWWPFLLSGSAASANSISSTRFSCGKELAGLEKSDDRRREEHVDAHTGI